MTTETKQATHTRLPWEMHVLGQEGRSYITIQRGQFDIVSGRYSGLGLEQDKADAEFIVRAVNSHGALVAALRAIQGLGCVPQGQPEYRLMEAALAKARGQAS